MNKNGKKDNKRNNSLNENKKSLINGLKCIKKKNPWNRNFRSKELLKLLYLKFSKDIKNC